MNRLTQDLEGKEPEKRIRIETPEEKLLREGAALRSAAMYIAWMDNPGEHGKPVSTTRKLVKGRASVGVTPGKPVTMDITREELTTPASITRHYRLSVTEEGVVTGTVAILGKRVNEIPISYGIGAKHGNIDFREVDKIEAFDPTETVFRATPETLVSLKRDLLRSEPFEQPAQQSTSSQPAATLKAGPIVSKVSA